MKPLYRGLLVGAIQCAMVLAIAGKYEVERASLPRVWVNATPVDPNLPLRGRYVSLRLQVDVPPGFTGYYQPVRLRVEDSRLVATASAAPTGLTVSHFQQRPWTLNEQVPFFIPESAADPSRLQPGEELWAEVSVPREGPPRPLRLALKKDGKLTPLELR